MNAYEFVVLSTLRAQQLMAGCLPRLEGHHKATTMAQMEVSEGRVVRADVGLAALPLEALPSLGPEVLSPALVGTE